MDIKESDLRLDKNSLILTALAMALLLLSSCGNDRGSDGVPRSNLRVSVELQSDLREHRNRHADIYVDDKLVTTVENGRSAIFSLPIGSHTISVSSDGFRTSEKEVEILEKSVPDFHFVLGLE